MSAFSLLERIAVAATRLADSERQLFDDLFVAGNLSLRLEPPSDPADDRIEVENALQHTLEDRNTPTLC